METRKDGKDSLDSTINTKDAENNSENPKSLTADESADTDPNEVDDKASFSDNREKYTKDKGQFDGNIGI